MNLEERIESLLTRSLQGKDSATHSFLHFKRTAIGARWFVEILGGNRRDQELAYIAGLLHDLDRPLSEEIDHAEVSAAKAREWLYGNFDLDERDITRIVQAIRDHRLPVRWKTALHQSVYLSDKILEQMGAYVVFRRCLFIAECLDYRGLPFEEAMLCHWHSRSSRFNAKMFPCRFRKLVKYQYWWPAKFYEGFRKKKAYAIELTNFCYNEIIRGEKSVETMVNGFKPMEDEGERFRKEALLYITGEKFREFKNLVDA